MKHTYLFLVFLFFNTFLSAQTGQIVHDPIILSFLNGESLTKKAHQTAEKEVWKSERKSRYFTNIFQNTQYGQLVSVIKDTTEIVADGKDNLRALIEQKEIIGAMRAEMSTVYNNIASLPAEAKKLTDEISTIDDAIKDSFEKMVSNFGCLTEDMSDYQKNESIYKAQWETRVQMNERGCGMKQDGLPLLKEALKTRVDALKDTFSKGMMNAKRMWEFNKANKSTEDEIEATKTQADREAYLLKLVARLLEMTSILQGTVDENNKKTAKEFLEERNLRAMINRKPPPGYQERIDEYNAYCEKIKCEPGDNTYANTKLKAWGYATKVNISQIFK